MGKNSTVQSQSFPSCQYGSKSSFRFVPKVARSPFLESKKKPEQCIGALFCEGREDLVIQAKRAKRLEIGPQKKLWTYQGLGGTSLLTPRKDS